MGLETTILLTQTFFIPAKAGIQSTVYSKSWADWVARYCSGKSAFNARDPRVKRLANKGCLFVGGYLHI